jgi:hypothetical protein
MKRGDSNTNCCGSLLRHVSPNTARGTPAVCFDREFGTRIMCLGRNLSGLVSRLCVGGMTFRKAECLNAPVRWCVYACERVCACVHVKVYIHIYVYIYIYIIQ